MGMILKLKEDPFKTTGSGTFVCLTEYVTFVYDFPDF